VEPLIAADSLDVAAGREVVLRGVSMRVYPREVVCVRGPSGSGKTSLLETLALARRPAGGSLTVAGVAADAPEDVLAWARARLVGYIPQDDRLVWELRVWENIALPLLLVGLPRPRERARAVAEALGIGRLLYRRPVELSGGQRRRVLVARALVKDPLVVVADEAAAGLDEASARLVYGALVGVAERGGAVVYATPDAAEPVPCTRELRIRGGRLLEA